MSPKSEQTNQQPGADRFWGQFSQSKAGRTNGGDGSQRQEPGAEGDTRNENCLEWCPICRSAELFRHTVSPELKQQAESIQHEAIGVLKAFLDAYTDKTANEPGTTSASGPKHDQPEDPPPPRVTEIPLD